MEQPRSRWCMQLSRSPDLKRLRDEGYEVTITEHGHLVISQVPYVGIDRQISFGQLVSTLNVVGDVAQYAGDHSVFFVGGTPGNRDGTPLAALINQPDLNQALEEGLVAAVGMSSKPEDNYRDYHHKMTSYVDMVSAHARIPRPERDCANSSRCGGRRSFRPIRIPRYVV